MPTGKTKEYGEIRSFKLSEGLAVPEAVKNTRQNEHTHPAEKFRETVPHDETDAELYLISGPF